jgi:hypothetical protein
MRVKQTSVKSQNARKEDSRKRRMVNRVQFVKERMRTRSRKSDAEDFLKMIETQTFHNILHLPVQLIF